MFSSLAYISILRLLFPRKNYFRTEIKGAIKSSIFAHYSAPIDIILLSGLPDNADNLEII